MDVRRERLVKPVAMIADAILDASERKGAVLDCFAGSGSTLVALLRCDSYPLGSIFKG
ncbi:MAG: DNA methyltransferase [Nitrobacter sp.]